MCLSFLWYLKILHITNTTLRGVINPVEDRSTKQCKHDEFREKHSRFNAMLSHEWDISNAYPPRCKCTGLKAQRPSLLSRERSIRWTLFWPFCPWQWSQQLQKLFWWHHLQVSFTAKLTVSDKKVKWSFQDQVRRTSVHVKTTITHHHIIDFVNSHPYQHHCCDSLWCSSTCLSSLAIFKIYSLRCAWKERSTHWCSPMAPSPSPSTSQRPLTPDDTSDTILQIRMTAYVRLLLAYELWCGWFSQPWSRIPSVRCVLANLEEISCETYLDVQRKSNRHSGGWQFLLAICWSKSLFCPISKRSPTRLRICLAGDWRVGSQSGKRDQRKTKLGWKQNKEPTV